MLAGVGQLGHEREQITTAYCSKQVVYVELRGSSHSCRAIATELGIHHSTASKVVKGVANTVSGQ